MAQMQVFVSHSHKDTKFCQSIVHGLRDAGADVWYDEHNMGSGRLGPTIEHELRRRPVFVVVLSPDALQSQWVEDETRWAYGLYRKDPSRIIQPVTARAINHDDVWLFLQDFKRIEASGSQPFSTDEAIRRLLYALALNPSGEPSTPTPPQPSESFDELLERGRALTAQKRYNEALVLFERATRLGPMSVEAWFSLGYVLDEVGQYSDSLAAYERALSLAPTLAHSWSGKGNALYGLHRYEEALAAYSHALTLGETRYRWSNQARVLRALGRASEAEAAERRANELGG